MHFELSTLTWNPLAAPLRFPAPLIPAMVDDSILDEDGDDEGQEGSTAAKLHCLNTNRILRIRRCWGCQISMKGVPKFMLKAMTSKILVY